MCWPIAGHDNKYFLRAMKSTSPILIKTVLTLHIIVSVGLLGDSAGYLAVAVHSANVTEPVAARASYQILQMGVIKSVDE